MLRAVTEIFYFWFRSVNSRFSDGFVCTAQFCGGKSWRRDRDFTWAKGSAQGLSGSLQSRCPSFLRWRSPGPALRCWPDRAVSLKREAAPWGVGFLSPRPLQGLPRRTDTRTLPGFPRRQQACPTAAAGSDGVPGRGNALFRFLFSCLRQKAQLALFFSALGPRFVLRFVSCGMGPGDTGASGCHQSHHRHPPALSKCCVRHSLATSVWLAMKCGDDLV